MRDVEKLEVARVVARLDKAEVADGALDPLPKRSGHGRRREAWRVASRVHHAPEAALRALRELTDFQLARLH